MGAKQSRVVMSETTTELGSKDFHDREPSVSLSLTQDLLEQIHGSQDTPKLDKEVVSDDESRREAIMKRQLQMAYKQVLYKYIQTEAALYGAEDYRKKVDMELKNQKDTTASMPTVAQQAQLAKEQEERENRRVQQLVAEINKKKYRAPLHDVQCSPEREACLQCYTDNNSDVLKCKEVADAFVRCARQNTEAAQSTIY
ncbi:hypothetical protein PsorP6_018369 [Peronosclerospora sorghi]|nr:hypothetical protein PsorP6_018369 [Peronosclerospora sorghi]